MADVNVSATSQFLDLAGLTAYNEKVKAELAKKVDVVPGKQLSTNDFTNDEKNKLETLENYVLPTASESAIGGVKVEGVNTTAPAKGKRALKVDQTGVEYVDWTEAPKASESEYGLLKLGNGLKTGEDGTIEVDGENVVAGEVDWTDVKNAPDFALKSDITDVYKYKGSVATYDQLPQSGTEGLTSGDVYNVTATDMNYAWTGTAWDPLGSTFTITAISTEQIDALFAD